MRCLDGCQRSRGSRRRSDSLVKAQAASNCKMVLGLLKNSTNRLMTPHSMTLSIGGFFSFESSLRNHISTRTQDNHRLTHFLNLVVASICASWLLL
jgi:hypothetical protein